MARQIVLLCGDSSSVSEALMDRSVCTAQYNAPVSRPSNMPEISNLEVMGLVFSKGQFNSQNCVYVKPYTGLGAYTFDIYYNKCGTKPDLNGKFYENTIIVQYDNELIEVWDEAKRLRCEWYNDYEKTATKPPVVIADLEVIELNFRGDNVDCWMEIQDGKGPWASPVTGIVPLGSTLTMVVAINDPNAEFDMRVKECEASDGKGRPIYLSDQDGCVLRPKMISKFMKLRSNDGRSTVITYAHFHAFKFPDSMYVHLKCKVEICRYGCPDHCQKAVAGGYASPSAPLVAAGSNYDPVVSNSVEESQPAAEPRKPVVVQAKLEEEYQAAPGGGGHTIRGIPLPLPPRDGINRMDMPADLPPLPAHYQPVLIAPSTHDVIGKPQAIPVPFNTDGRHAEAASRSAAADTPAEAVRTSDAGLGGVDRSEFPWGPRKLKIRRRRFVVDEPAAKSADIGVASTLEVISENDLQFEPTYEDNQRVTIFQGQIRDDIVYGICLPAAGFSALFVLLAMCAVISVLVAGFLCHHRQVQKDSSRQPAAVPLRDWNMVGFIRQRFQPAH
ncbi:uncharacterized protein LOC119097303 [Pollicipes pollicipes]|uniref:uncharacterized protein LOC119097303 n=1 Tax=Pollicipes pollicipes TaxID=41117 RepID=UPI001884A2D8|nr:uncharacterized protein LOC119097303 [Pollicipes pollicipes]